MKSNLRVLFAALIALSAVIFLSAQQPVQRDQVEEKQIEARLEKIAPSVVETFREATRQMDAGQQKEAIRLYDLVLAKAPKFDAALRRSGGLMVETGFREQGLARCNEAVAIDRSPYNLLALAMARTARVTGFQEPSQDEFKGALSLLLEAKLKDQTADPMIIMVAAETSLEAGDIEQFKVLSAEIDQRFPGTLEAHYFNTIRYTENLEFDRARAELKSAEALGLKPETAAQVNSEIQRIESEQPYDFASYFYYGFILVAIWAVGLIALIIFGQILSSRTLSTLESSDANDIHGKAQAGLRSMYRLMIKIAAVYYYLSQPILILMVVGIVVGSILLFLMAGRIPIQLMVILIVGGIVTIFHLVKSLLTKKNTEDPGVVLTQQEAPGLWKLVRDVAATLNTRPIDEIRLTPGSELAVYERGGAAAKIKDEADRILILGTATLGGFSQNAFRAVLAHEYGHFSNRDTAGGDIAFRVEKDIMIFAESLAASGAAVWYNLAFQFLRLYHFIFRRITLGATRLQEILADRVAVYHYGADAFRAGLDHVIRRDLAFTFSADREIDEALKQQRPFSNFYEVADGVNEIPRIEEQFKEIIYRETTKDDSHPSPADRYKHAVLVRSKRTPPLEGMVWDLFADREATTKRMHEMLVDHVNEVIAYQAALEAQENQ